MLEAYGLTRAQSMASLCYTLCTFFPNVSGIRVSINDTPVTQLQLEEDLKYPSALRKMCSCAAIFPLCSMITAPFSLPTRMASACARSSAPVVYTQRVSPRTLLIELARGPQAYDSVEGLTAVMPVGAIQDTDILGLALSGEHDAGQFSPPPLKAWARIWTKPGSVCWPMPWSTRSAPAPARTACASSSRRCPI